MKQFLKKCMAFFLILCLIFLPPAMIFDPYNIFHWEHLRNNGVEPNKAYLKMKNVLKNPDRFDSFLFGSSRMGFFDVEKMDDGIYYDMAYSEGLPAEHLENLRVMLENGIVPKNVTIGIDDISYFVEPSMHKTQLFRSPYPWGSSVREQGEFYLKYFDLITIAQSVDVVLDHEDRDPEYGERLLRTGTENLGIISEFNYENTEATWCDYYEPREQVLEEIREIIRLCDEHGIRLRFFTNPINGYTYAKDIANGYLVFLEELAEVTDYYNFSGFNDITLNNALYYETSHFTPEVADMVIDRIYHDREDERLLSQGFGYYVTPENVNDLIDILKAQAINFDLPVNTYPDVSKP